MVYLELVAGFIYLLMGGDLLVRGAVAMARRARVSPAVIALSIVALGTSLPELIVTVRAVWDGHPGIAIGNVVGSNIANVSLVVGLPAILYPLSVSDGSTRRDSAIMLGASLLFVLLCFVGDLGRLEGSALLAGLAIWAVYTARRGTRAPRTVDSRTPLEFVLGLPTRTWMIALFMGAGVVGLPLGARLLVESAARIATYLGVSDAIVGLTIVALGTSLPEVTTCAIAAAQRHSDVALATAVGSNIFNILAIMGAATLVSPGPIPVPPGFLRLDLPVMLLAAALLAAFVWRARLIGRTAGLVLLAGYGLYLAALFDLV